MTAVRPRRARPKRRWPRRLALALVVGVAFVAGIGLGEALNDNPDPGGTQTVIRTLHPRPLVPVVQSTVTVTVSTSTS
jgi:hypothetical protein